MATDKHGMLMQLQRNRWALEPETLRSLIALASAADFPTAEQVKSLAIDTPSAEEPSYNLVDGIAIIPIHGMIIKDAPWWYELLGMTVTDPAIAQQAIEEAVLDPAVEAIMLDVNSPGGHIDGCQELSDAIYAARAVKPVHAHIDDLGASAAYEFASQAGRLSANATAAVGSIGVYCILDDYSKAYEDAGIKVNLVRSGPYKGTGVEGVPIPNEELKPIQEEIDGLAALFVNAVARGRGMDTAAVARLATGRTWLAQQAHMLGLIDTVQTADEAFDTLAETVNPNAGDQAMRLFQKRNKAKEQADADRLAAELAETEKQAAEQAEAEKQAAAKEAAAEEAKAMEAEAAAETEQSQPEGQESGAETIDAAELNLRTDLFGAEFAVASLKDGLDREEAFSLGIQQCRERIAALETELTEQKAQHDAKLKALGVLGEETPASASPSDPEAEATAADIAKHEVAVGPNLAITAAAFGKQIHKKS